MAQFSSFIDPLLILLAIPPGITGVILFLLATHTTVNVMSLMGVIMMTGIRGLEQHSYCGVHAIIEERRHADRKAVATACRVRLRPVLMTSLATILGMIPMALALEAGSEQYAPLARAIIGGLSMSVVVTVFIVPAAYLLIHRREERPAPAFERARLRKLLFDVASASSRPGVGRFQRDETFTDCCRVVSTCLAVCPNLFEYARG